MAPNSTREDPRRFEIAAESVKNVACHAVRPEIIAAPDASSSVGEISMKSRTVLVNDRMQRGYRYVLVEPPGQNFDPEFRPELTPEEMLRLGVFGGKYITDCREEFPRPWFAQAKLSPGRADPALNYFGVGASQSLSVWRKKGWLLQRSARLVPMVLSLFYGPPLAGRGSAAD